MRISQPSNQTLIAIGGALRVERPDILQDFIRRAGGSAAHIVVLPTASSQADTGPYYANLLNQLGAGQVNTLEICERADANQPTYVQAMEQASGVFITGGNQGRLTAILGGSAAEAALLRLYARGGIVAGTSAGAACLSAVMLAFGRNGAIPRQGMAQFTPGFGLIDRVIIDQHFRQRDRLGRLLYAIASHPGVLGVGVDENTAAIFETTHSEANETIHMSVLGKNAVTIVDGADIGASNLAETTGRRPIAISGLRVHVLTQGCTFDLKERTAHIPVRR